MKICQIITTLIYGGAERLLVNFANIHAVEHSVDVIYLKFEPQLAGQLSPAINLHHIPLNRYCAANLSNLLKELQPDVIHTHLTHADFLGLWAAKSLPARQFCTMHNIWFKWDWRDYLIFAAYRGLFNLVAPRSHVIGISQSVGEHVINRLKVPPRRVSVINNAIPQLDAPLDYREMRRLLNIPPEAFCLLFIGRLRLQKSVDTLLLATAQLKSLIPNLLVLLVGEGQGYEQDNLRQLSRDLGLSDVVQFRGVTAQPELYLSAADVFVLPSIFEGFGLVILEAFRAALPVIATNIEGPKQLIENGYNGLLFTPKNEAQLTEKILTLFGDAELRQKLGVQGYQSFRNNFTIEKYAQKLETLYTNPTT